MAACTQISFSVLSDGEVPQHWAETIRGGYYVNPDD